jgi:predicted HTH transcriptional regulator
MKRKDSGEWRVRRDDKIHDVVLTRYSKNGDPELDVIFELKTIGPRREVVSVCIKSAGRKFAVTATDIRSIPFSELENMERQEQPDLVIRDTRVEFDSGPQSGKPLTNADLKIVAHLYRKARNLGVPTASYIANQLDISESTVGKRISAARKAGLLGAALGTKAGERPIRTTGKRK